MSYGHCLVLTASIVTVSGLLSAVTSGGAVALGGAGALLIGLVLILTQRRDFSARVDWHVPSDEARRRWIEQERRP